MRAIDPKSGKIVWEVKNPAPLWGGVLMGAIGAVPVPLYPTLGVEATANIFRDSEAKVVATIGWFRKGVEESQAAAAGVSRWARLTSPTRALSASRTAS